MTVVAIPNEFTVGQDFKNAYQTIHELSENVLHDFVLEGNE